MLRRVFSDPRGTGCRMTETDLQALVRLLQEKTPLHQLSNMEARTVFEWMLQQNYTITPPQRLRQS